VLATEPDAIAISLDHPEMTRFVNGVLAQIEQDRTWTNIMKMNRLDTLLESDIPPPPVARYRD
jgi:polar amino acid transport system substrate-binding protein